MELDVGRCDLPEAGERNVTVRPVELPGQVVDAPVPDPPGRLPLRVLRRIAKQDCVRGREQANRLAGLLIRQLRARYLDGLLRKAETDGADDALRDRIERLLGFPEAQQPDDKQ